MLRQTFQSFSRWRLETQVEKRALDRRQQLFMINNAKLEVQRSKAALQSLYRQRISGATPPNASQLENAGSMLVLHPLSHTAAVQTSVGHSKTPSVAEEPPMSAKDQI